MSNAVSVSTGVVRRNRITLVAIVLVFVLPVLGAWLYYLGVAEHGPGATSNRGVLVRPARPIGAVALTDADGAALDAALWRGKWTLVQVEDGPCDEGCRHRLYKTRQVRLALNKDISRVQRVVLAPGGYPVEAVTWLRQNHPQLILATGSAAALAGLMEELRVDQEPASVRAHRTYLLDPLGNFMMWYAGEQDPKDIVEDLRKLLKVSQIG